MNREERNKLSRQRILDAALLAFSADGYERAALNSVWTENEISKGVIYHYFKDKNEIYLLCVQMCFDAMTAYLSQKVERLSGTATQRLHEYFDARLNFFAESPVYLGIFSDAVFHPPTALAASIAECRKAFDALNVSVLTGLLNSEPLRKGLTVEEIVEDFRMYLDFFHLRYQTALNENRSIESVLQEHEERCRRQIDILLHGVLSHYDEK